MRTALGPGCRTDQGDLVDLDAAAETYAGLVADLPPGSARSGARDAMVSAALPFAGRLARRYRNRGEPLEDLEQVARLGLVKAVDRYDPERGSFTAFAVITITGELRRHFRDHSWGVHVPRRLQELSLDVTQATTILTNQLSRSPTTGELAEYLGVDESEVRTGQELAVAYTATSLNRPVSEDGRAELGEMLGGPDGELALVEDRLTVAKLIARMPAREQRILAMRFYGNHTQDEIAAQFGISQMHVSRLLSKALTWLRHAMLTDGPAIWPDSSPGATPSARVTHERQRVTVAVRGEIDRDSASTLRTGLASAIRTADGARFVLVDFDEVPFIDAAGLAALVDAEADARLAGLRVVIRQAPVHVRRVITAAGLHRLLEPVRAPQPV
ncbi:SigB/SigF/SigG family RNA polymerase sigma factor [Pilimelia columellifera]|uniref:STAS domain-containing protein n=1 Tax=Pilimelia columellifera subsp. columellifera TaxID=706583 RepID=A0ABP6AM39_9ACTN